MLFRSRLQKMKNKNILIAVTGSIAAYKACEVVRLLRKEGANVQVMMSKSAMEFVGKTTFAALTDNEVITELFSNTPKAGLEHIEMAIELDAIVVGDITTALKKLSKCINHYDIKKFKNKRHKNICTLKILIYY